MTEANLWSSTEEADRVIQGFNLILPSTMEHLHHARIALLVKTDLKVHVLREHMEEDTAVIWIRIGQTKNRTLTIGGIYRQHQILGRTSRTDTRLELQNQQEERWNRIIGKWNFFFKKWGEMYNNRRPKS